MSGDRIYIHRQPTYTISTKTCIRVTQVGVKVTYRFPANSLILPVTLISFKSGRSPEIPISLSDFDHDKHRYKTDDRKEGRG